MSYSAEGGIRYLLYYKKPACLRSTKHLVNFAWLENNGACSYADMYLRTDDPPATTTESIAKAFMPLDFGESWVTPTFSLGADQAKVNRSYQYWHQRINNSGCWNKVRLGQFDLGTGMWHGISYLGLLDWKQCITSPHARCVSRCIRMRPGNEDSEKYRHAPFTKRKNRLYRSIKNDGGCKR